MQAPRVHSVAHLSIVVVISLVSAGCGHHMDETVETTADAALARPDTTLPLDASVADSPAGTPLTLGVVGTHGEVLYALGGTKGTVLCFHGAGGLAAAWNSGERRLQLDALIANGYSVVCPTSVDRSTKQWSPDNTASNADVLNIDGLLVDLGVPANAKLFLIGHSNGGGFTTRFALLSARSSAVRAIQISNASGLGPAMQLASYVYPTLFNYADCDPVVDAADVRANQQLLAGKKPPVSFIDNDLDAVYASGPFQTCHEFASTPQITTAFFGAY